jgi:hypothetical protein
MTSLSLREMAPCGSFPHRCTTQANSGTPVQVGEVHKETMAKSTQQRTHARRGTQHDTLACFCIRSLALGPPFRLANGGPVARPFPLLTRAGPVQRAKRALGMDSCAGESFPPRLSYLFASPMFVEEGGCRKRCEPLMVRSELDTLSRICQASKRIELCAQVATVSSLCAVGPLISHIACHCEKRSDGRASLLVEDSQGVGQWLSEDELCCLMKGRVCPPPQLVVLNCCHSELFARLFLRLGGACAPWRDKVVLRLRALLVAVHFVVSFGAVVRIPDVLALMFTDELYTALLLDGLTVADAVGRVSQRITAEREDLGSVVRLAVHPEASAPLLLPPSPPPCASATTPLPPPFSWTEGSFRFHRTSVTGAYSLLCGSEAGVALVVTGPSISSKTNVGVGKTFFLKQLMHMVALRSLENGFDELVYVKPCALRSVARALAQRTVHVGEWLEFLADSASRLRRVMVRGEGWQWVVESLSCSSSSAKDLSSSSSTSVERCAKTLVCLEFGHDSAGRGSYVAYQPIVEAIAGVMARRSRLSFVLESSCAVSDASPLPERFTIVHLSQLNPLFACSAMLPEWLQRQLEGVLKASPCHPLAEALRPVMCSPCGCQWLIQYSKGKDLLSLPPQELEDAVGGYLDGLVHARDCILEFVLAPSAGLSRRARDSLGLTTESPAVVASSSLSSTVSLAPVAEASPPSQGCSVRTIDPALRQSGTDRLCTVDVEPHLLYAESGEFEAAAPAAALPLSSDPADLERWVASVTQEMVDELQSCFPMEHVVGDESSPSARRRVAAPREWVCWVPTVAERWLTFFASQHAPRASENASRGGLTRRDLEPFCLASTLQHAARQRDEEKGTLRIQRVARNSLGVASVWHVRLVREWVQHWLLPFVELLRSLHSEWTVVHQGARMRTVFGSKTFEETEELLAGFSPGTFLVRMSGSHRHVGSLVAGLVVKGGGVVQMRVARLPEGGWQLLEKDSPPIEARTLSELFRADPRFQERLMLPTKTDIV